MNLQCYFFCSNNADLHSINKTSIVLILILVGMCSTAGRVTMCECSYVCVPLPGSISTGNTGRGERPKLQLYKKSFINNILSC